MKTPLTEAQFIERIIRVNHAGEYAAIRIYKFQAMMFWRDKEFRSMINHMEQQEHQHLEYFSKSLDQYKVKRTKLLPLWKVSSSILGCGTALMGKKAAMACTVAVENVISGHYQEQISQLDDCELRDKIKQFRQEELEHHDIGIDNQAQEMPGYKILSTIVKLGCKVAIALSRRV